MRHFIPRWTAYKTANANTTDEWQYAVHHPKEKKKEKTKTKQQGSNLKLSIYSVRL